MAISLIPPTLVLFESVDVPFFLSSLACCTYVGALAQGEIVSPVTLGWLVRFPALPCVYRLWVV